MTSGAASLSRRPAFLSVDCDGEGAYCAAYGLAPRGGERDAIYLAGLPRLLDLFAEVGARATFFLVGREAARPAHRAVLRRIVAEGHEVGSHSMTHPPHFARLGPAEVRRELCDAHAAIADATGQAPQGFRAPVHGISEPALDVLEELGYRYDASVFPSAFFALQQRIIRARSDGRARHLVAGDLRWHLAPLTPYRPARGAVWRRGHRRIVEIPLAVVPGLRAPFYGTFLLWAGRPYLRCAWPLVARHPAPALQYHPMELVQAGLEGVDRALARVPAARRPVPRKARFIRACLALAATRFDLLPGGAYLARSPA